MIVRKRNTTVDVLKTNYREEVRIKTRNIAFVNRDQQETHNMSGRILCNKKTRPQRSGSAIYIKIGMNSTCPTDRQHKEKILGLEIQGKGSKFYIRNVIENNSKRYSFILDQDK